MQVLEDWNVLTSMVRDVILADNTRVMLTVQRCGSGWHALAAVVPPVQRRDVAFPYGACPMCGARGVSRTRFGATFDTCERGHRYLTKHAVRKEECPTAPDLATDAYQRAKVTDLGPENGGPLPRAVDLADAFLESMRRAHG